MRAIVIAVLLVACGPTRVRVEPVRVQPIHITVDVNVRDQSASPTGDPSATSR